MAGNTVLDMPFDETEFSPVAYDYSPAANHAAVTDGRFIPGRFGNCLYFSTEGLAEIIPDIIEWGGDFTYMIWILVHGYGYDPWTTQLEIKFPGINNRLIIDLADDFSVWTHFALTKEGNILRVYKNGKFYKSIAQTGADLTGFRMVNTLPHPTGGFVSFDDAKIINGEAINPDEIGEIIDNQTIQPVNVSINNVLLTDYGVWVDGISGQFGRPPKKDGLKVDWPDEHGSVRAVGAVDIYEEKQISLSCFMEGSSLDDFFSKWYSFVAAVSGRGTFRLQLDAGTKKIVGQVRLEQELDVDKDSMVEGQNFGRFKLNLVEPQPVKRVLRVLGSSVSITIATSHKMSIYWGDGSQTLNAGTGTHSHNYPGSGEYYVIVAGRLDKLTAFSFSSEAIVHINLLV